MTAPLFSVWISTRNSEDFIGRTIDSLRGQSVCSWEAVFVDDASSDATWERACAAADGDHRIQLIRNAERRCQVACYLQVLPLLTGRIVCELDGDDWFPDSASLAQIASVYDADLDIEATAGRHIIDGANISGDVLSWPRESGFWQRLLRPYAPRTWLRSLAVKAAAEYAWAYVDEDGKPWESAGDVALWAPIAYMAKAIGTTKTPAYYVNRDNLESDWRLDEKLQQDCAMRIRAKWEQHLMGISQ